MGRDDVIRITEQVIKSLSVDIDKSEVAGSTTIEVTLRYGDKVISKDEITIPVKTPPKFPIKAQ